MKRHVWKVSYFFIKWLTKIETSSTFLNSHQKILENFRKFRFSNFHLENSRTWIFTLWNHILQTQTSLLQPILVYTYIYNNCLLLFLYSLPLYLELYLLVGFEGHLSYQPFLLLFLDHEDRFLGCSHCLG